MKIDGLTHRLLAMKEAYRARDNTFHFGVVDDINEFKFTGRSIVVVVEAENETLTKKTVDLTFYYAKARPSGGEAALNFRSESKSLTKFISEFEDDDFFTEQFQTKYGIAEGVREDFSVAEIKGTFDITRLRDVETSDDDIYEKMNDLFINVKVVE